MSRDTTKPTILACRYFPHKVKGRYAAKPGTRAAQAFGPRARPGDQKTQDTQESLATSTRTIKARHDGFDGPSTSLTPWIAVWPTSVSLYSSYFLNRRTAAARPGWVEVIGGPLLQQLPTVECGSTLACGPPVTVARPWLKRGLPSSK